MFQFTHPGRGATCIVLRTLFNLCKFQFTHPGRGATAPILDIVQSIPVSIHAPREGCDGLPRILERCIESFNSRTPGGVRHKKSNYTPFTLLVSIHAPREGCDVGTFSRQWIRKAVSIHAPREGCDGGVAKLPLQMLRFNSRTPGGVRRESRMISLKECGFNSRTPGGVRPKQGSLYRRVRRVSIHAPREGCDLQIDSTKRPRRSFNSHTPGGVRLGTAPPLRP